jgi:hypothetical protein
MRFAISFDVSAIKLNLFDKFILKTNQEFRRKSGFLKIIGIAGAKRNPSRPVNIFSLSA